MFNCKNKILTNVYYKDTNTHDHLIYDSAHPEFCKKKLSYNLAKRIVFETNPEKH